MKNTKEKILVESARLFMQNGFEGTSVAQIAAAVGIAPSSLFSHFKSKEEIFQKVLDRYVINVQTPREKFGDCSSLSLQGFIELYLQKMEKTMELLHSTIKGGSKTPIQYFGFTLECGKMSDECSKAVLSFDKEEVDLWKNRISFAQSNGEIRTDIDPHGLAEIFRYSFLGISYMYTMRGGVTVDQVRKILYNIYNAVKI